MRLLIITEKCSPLENERDGGARLVDTLLKAFPNEAAILQFGPQPDDRANWHFAYPETHPDRFLRRVKNAPFVGKVVEKIAPPFTHFLFVHISLQFGLKFANLPPNSTTLTFPMFLAPSYIISGEVVPKEYHRLEKEALIFSDSILTPSHLEKRQLVEIYGIAKEKISVVPRGISTQLFSPKVRSVKHYPVFCSLGSVKPQKNTLELISLFSKLASLYPGTVLRIIGPVQNQTYYQKVISEISRLDLTDHVEFFGFIPPENISLVLGDAQIHLSCSLCETFGRAIFETLAMGIPNVAKKKGNAAAEYLSGFPYARFVDREEEAIEAIDALLVDLSTHSKMAREIGNLFDEALLSTLLVAKIRGKELITISDFDGTLYHKDNSGKTETSMKRFRELPNKVICSARGLDDLCEQAEKFALKPDWIIAYSGGVLAKGDGELILEYPLTEEQITTLKSQIPDVGFVSFQEKIFQGFSDENKLPDLLGFRCEKYQGRTFFSRWEASKLHMVHSLLRKIDWKGQVEVFGDGPYDTDLITYFDGMWIT